MQDNSGASSPTTPPNQAASSSHFTSELSPPDSQQLSATANPANVASPTPLTPLAGAGSSKASTAANANPSKKMPPSANLNANGKREWNNNGIEKAGVEKESGYSWEKEEDAPGYSWNNGKAREEAQRAWQGVLEKERRVGNKYGDVLLK